MSQPKGIPSITYVRVLSSAAGQGDIVSDGNNSLTILEPGYPSTRHEVAHVLDKGISDEDVCESIIGSQAGAGLGLALNPVAGLVHDAVNVCMFAIGSKFTRKGLFLKRSFLPFLADELFQILAEKERESIDYYQAQVHFSSFEIQDEIITDLLRPSSRGLSVSITAEDGVIVSGLHKEIVNDVKSLRKHMLDACENRAMHTLPPGASLETSSACWEITLTQNESSESTGDTMRTCTSRLVIVDIPCINPLVTGGANLRQLEGPTLHKSLMSFMDVAKKLSTPSRAALASFRSSKLTHYLSEMLGGNSIVVGLGLLSSGEPAISRKTLELMASLTSSVHFPIGGRELTGILQGLLTKYRSMVLQLQDEILVTSLTLDDKKKSDLNHSAEQITQIQKDIAEAQLQRNKAIEDRSRIFEMMELLKAKYNTILEQKTFQSQELIRNEEDKLSIARALVELKLEHSQLEETLEKERFDLTSALLSAKNQNFDLDAQILLARTEGNAFKDSSIKFEQLLKIQKEENVSLNTSLAEVREHLQREEDKNIEMGTEILTLINQGNFLQHQCNDLQQRLDISSVKLAAFSSKGDESDVSMDKLRKQMRTNEEDVISTKKLLAESELELRRINMDFARCQNDLERTIKDHNKEKDELTKAHELEKISIQQNLQSNKDGQSQQRKVDNNAAELKRLERRARDLERDLKRSNEDLASCRNERSSVDLQLTTLRQNYRTKLSSLLVEDDRITTPLDPDLKSENKNSIKKTNVSSGTASETILNDLVSSYVENERKMKHDVESSLTNAATTRQELRILFDKYRATLDALEDSSPRIANSLNKDGQLSEHQLLGDSALAEATVSINNSELFERDALTQRLRLAEDSVIIEQQRATTVLNTYKRNLEKTEKNLAESRKEVASLNAQMRQLYNTKKEEKTDDLEKIHKENQKNIQEDLLKILVEQVKSTVVPVRPSSRPHTPANAANENIIKKLTLDIEKLNSELNRAKEYIDRLENDGNNALLSKLQDAERRAVQMETRNMSLEEELESYRKYMRDAMVQHQKQVQGLQKKLLKPFNNNNNQPKEHLRSEDDKFPVIAISNGIKK